MYIAVFIAVVIVAVVIIVSENRKKKAAGLKQQETHDKVQEMRNNFWPQHELFPKLINFMTCSVTAQINSAVKYDLKVSPDAREYMCFEARTGGLFAFTDTDEVNMGTRINRGKLMLEEAGYENITAEQAASLNFALYDAARKEFEGKYPVTYHKGIVYVRIDSAYPKKNLKKI